MGMAFPLHYTPEYAVENWVKINPEKNYLKTHPMKWHVPKFKYGTEQVQTAKLLGVIFQRNFNFTSHTDAVLKLCSQRLFLLKHLHDKGLSRGHLHTIVQAIVLNRRAHALSRRINGF